MRRPTALPVLRLTDTAAECALLAKQFAARRKMWEAYLDRQRAKAGLTPYRSDGSSVDRAAKAI